jgi:glycolate oxidase FAD binding subunit
MSGNALRPADENELREIVRAAVAEKMTLEVRGAGTKRGLGRPVSADAPLDLTRFAGVKTYEPEELVLTAGAATPIIEIERLVAQKGQRLAFEPPDYSPLYGGAAGRQTLAGVVAANLAGSRRISAGAARDHFLGFRAVNGRGESFKAGGQVVKNVTGYDLCKLLAGSYGTLAILTEMTVKVLPVAET